MVVSIHDVSPMTRGRTQDILDDLRSVGVTRTSLLVIPDHHHRGNIASDARFGAWLRERCTEGHEAVVHGFYHLREGSRADGPWKRVVTRLYTAGEGEFYDLDATSASERLDAGKAAFAACGVVATGFVAPAWLLGDEAEGAVRKAGFSYTTRIGEVIDFQSGVVHPARSLVWSVRARWRRVCSLAWNRALFGRLSGSPLLRVGIHPPDWDHPAIRRQILEIARSALAGRAPMTYDGWLAHTRAPL